MTPPKQSDPLDLLSSRVDRMAEIGPAIVKAMNQQTDATERQTVAIEKRPTTRQWLGGVVAIILAVSIAGVAVNRASAARGKSSRANSQTLVNCLTPGDPTAKVSADRSHPCFDKVQQANIAVFATGVNCLLAGQAGTDLPKCIADVLAGNPPPPLIQSNAPPTTTTTTTATTTTVARPSPRSSVATSAARTGTTSKSSPSGTSSSPSSTRPPTSLPASPPTSRCQVNLPTGLCLSVPPVPLGGS